VASASTEKKPLQRKFINLPQNLECSPFQGLIQLRQSKHFAYLSSSINIPKYKIGTMESLVRHQLLASMMWGIRCCFSLPASAPGKGSACTRCCWMGNNGRHKRWSFAAYTTNSILNLCNNLNPSCGLAFKRKILTKSAIVVICLATTTLRFSTSHFPRCFHLANDQLFLLNETDI
jgi:hypothetical protein